MVLKTIHAVVAGNSKEATQQGANEESRRIRKIEAKDVAHEVMRLRARERHEQLDNLVRNGTPNLKREQFKSCVQKRVFEIVSETFDLMNGPVADEITEEITETICMAADADPAYREMFEEE